MPLLIDHPDRRTLRTQLRSNVALRRMSSETFNELEPLLMITTYKKGDTLLAQGNRNMEQFFILDGIVKRVVSSAEGKEMILRFAQAGEMDTSYAAWRLKTPAPYSIRAVTKVQVAKMPLPLWAAFLEQHPDVKHEFEYDVMQLMSDVMAHSITLHLLDAQGRVARFKRKHPELYEVIPQKELASYLNITAETLSRLKHQGKI